MFKVAKIASTHRCAESSLGCEMSQAWKWGIAVGVLIALIGLIFIPAGFAARNSDTTSLSAGLAIFAMGLVTVSVAFYSQARSIQSRVAANPNSSALSTGKQRKLVCDVCHKGSAVIQCTMHKTVLCPACLEGHYESRGCVYVPTVRRTAMRTARGAVASRS
jgi:hypothetical protein